MHGQRNVKLCERLLPSRKRISVRMQSILPSATDVNFSWNKILKFPAFISQRKHIRYAGLFITSELLRAQSNGQTPNSSGSKLNVFFIHKTNWILLRCAQYYSTLLLLHVSAYNLTVIREFTHKLKILQNSRVYNNNDSKCYCCKLLLFSKF